MNPRAFVAALAVVLLCPAGALAAEQDIASSGPLDNVYVHDDLDCQVTHTGDTGAEFFGGDPGTCATFLATGGSLYGSPDAGGPTVDSDFTPVSQSAVTGSGTSGDPYKIVTVADADVAEITETDSYVPGQESYRTDIQVQNGGATTLTATLYHAGDCHAHDDDFGFGFFDAASGGIYCAENANDSPPGILEGFVPIGSSPNYDETDPATLWGEIDSGGDALPDHCDCTTSTGTAAGLSWALSIPPHGSVSDSFSTLVQEDGPSPDPTSPPSPAIGLGAVPPRALPPPPVASARVRVPGGKLLAISKRRHRTSLALQCEAAAGDSCRLRGSLHALLHHRRIVLGSLAGSAAGQRITVFPIRLKRIPPALRGHALRGSLALTSTTHSQGVAHLTLPFTFEEQTGRPPTVSTVSASDISPPSYDGGGSPGGALLAGTVDPNGAATSYHLEVGFAPGAYSMVAGALNRSVGSDHLKHLVTGSIDSLLAGATYHYRVVAQNRNGIANGADRTFQVPVVNPPFGGIPVGDGTEAGTVVLILSDVCNLTSGLAVVEGATIHCTIMAQNPQPPVIGPVGVRAATVVLDAMAPGTLVSSSKTPNAQLPMTIPPSASLPAVVDFTVEHPHAALTPMVTQAGGGAPGTAAPLAVAEPRLHASVSCSPVGSRAPRENGVISCEIATSNTGLDSADFETFELAPSKYLADATTASGAPPAVVGAVGTGTASSTTRVTFRVARSAPSGAGLSVRLKALGRNETDENPFSLDVSSSTLHVGGRRAR